jgi:hypothetical protein
MQEIEQQEYALERKRKALEAQISALKADYDAVETETLKNLSLKKKKIELALQDQGKMAQSRKSDESTEQ